MQSTYACVCGAFTCTRPQCAGDSRERHYVMPQTLSVSSAPLQPGGISRHAVRRVWVCASGGGELPGLRKRCGALVGHRGVDSGLARSGIRHAAAPRPTTRARARRRRAGCCRGPAAAAGGRASGGAVGSRTTSWRGRPARYPPRLAEGGVALRCAACAAVYAVFAVAAGPLSPRAFASSPPRSVRRSEAGALDLGGLRIPSASRSSLVRSGRSVGSLQRRVTRSALRAIKPSAPPPC